MRNMMIRPTEEELEELGDPDFIIYNAGVCPADPTVEGVGSTTCVAIDVDNQEMVILGTEYAGEMKKGIFSVMHYLMPLAGKLTLHSGCNVGAQGDVSLFFGLSGTGVKLPCTAGRQWLPVWMLRESCVCLHAVAFHCHDIRAGKTTLSADPNRPLIGDDEHCWTDDGISNLEGGCYAKCINLSAEKEPDIFNAIREGAVLENVVVDRNTGVVSLCLHSQLSLSALIMLHCVICVVGKGESGRGSDCPS